MSLIEVSIPQEFIQLASEWHGGQNDLLYAVASTGGLTLGSIRPFDRDADRFLSDAEWHISIWNGLESDIRAARKLAHKSGNSDWNMLMSFELFAEEMGESLRLAYGLLDSDVV